MTTVKRSIKTKGAIIDNLIEIFKKWKHNRYRKNLDKRIKKSMEKHPPPLFPTNFFKK